MQRLVGIFRVEADLDEALGRAGRAAPRGGRPSGPPAVASTTRAGTSSSSCDNLLTISEAIARSARQRTESRGAHSRLDYPATDDAHWGSRNSVVVARPRRRRWRSTTAPLPPMPDELRALLGSGDH